MKDAINPSHYQLPNGLQLIDLTEHMNFCRGNAMKYLFRAGQKSPEKEIEDLQKARWYLDREIARLIGSTPAEPDPLARASLTDGITMTKCEIPPGTQWVMVSDGLQPFE